MKLNFLRILTFASAALFLASCGDDDGDGNMDPAITGSFVATNQEVENNTVIVSSVTMSQDGWVVIHRDNNGSPVVPGIISEPKWVEAGTSTDVEVMLKEGETVEEDEDIWIMLHTDNGQAEVYEFDGANGLDGPVTDAQGNIVMSPITVLGEATGSFTAEDQAVRNNKVMIKSVTVNRKAWVVIHADNGSGGPVVPGIISEPKQVEAGTTQDVEVMLKDGVTVEDDQTIWIMLHTDDGTIGEYEFDGSNGLDAPLMADGNIVMSSIMVDLAATASFSVTDQTIMDNMITVSSATFNKDGWIVIHADNGEGAPVVPAIISVPKYVEAGTSEDIMVEFKEDANVMAGDKIWVMLHTDNGTMMEYEFDGANGFDGPIFDDDGNMVITQITVDLVPMGSLTVTNQPILDNMLTVGSVTMNKAGWIVVHNDTGENAPVVPGIISTPKYVEAGTTAKVELMINEGAQINENGKVWVMLHTDDGTMMEYEFDGSENSNDKPILDTESQVVMTQISVD
ncbi:DUF7282 domain-containing protein [Fulvivirga ligni]|uniref:DUF7282 domain-containing protein n=1 Tax=Fulvivirga ligni TaxID=2904246 RepID=UPI001F48438B|nr:hypothetical protein [Fulvivirga ligni]UII21346.1 hypothetical protein LVD16_26290 [Fulvivirga ligni]